MNIKKNTCASYCKSKVTKSKSTTRLLPTAAANSNLESYTPACSLMRVSRREHATIPWSPMVSRTCSKYNKS